MATQITLRPITADEYARMREVGILREDDRVELIAGEIRQMSPIGPIHAAIVRRLTTMLMQMLGDTAIVSVQSPVRLSDESEPKPDIAVLKWREVRHGGSIRPVSRARLRPVVTLSTLLFLCTGNFYRSRYAELLFNATKPASLNWHAISRGFDPSPFNPGPIAAASLERLASRGYARPADVPYPKRLTEVDLAKAQRIIALDAHEHPPYVRHWFPPWETKIEYWHVPDLDRMGAGEALGLIEFNVETLLRDLACAC